MTTLIHEENELTTRTMTKTEPPQWLLAFWKEIDDKTFGKGFDCFTEDATCNLGIADWHGREQIRENLRAFIDSGFTALHHVVEYWDAGSLRNVLLLASGYAPTYNESAWDAPEMAVVTKAIDRVLLQQEPHPALALDRYWNVIRTNEATPRFFGSFVDLEARPHPRNLLDLMFDPAGMRPFVEGWEEVAAGLLQRVYRESIGHVVDQKTVELLNRLEKYPGVKGLSTVPRTHSPVLPITFVKGSEHLTYFSLITTVGTPQSITAQELRIECMFPLEPEGK